MSTAVVCQDPVIGEYPAERVGELMLCREHGVAWQPDPRSYAYGERYWAEYEERRGTAVAAALNAFRVALVRDYCQAVLDVGIGSGEFLEHFWSSGGLALGYDVNPFGARWLKGRGIWCDPWLVWPTAVDAVTLFDVLEHMPQPSRFLELTPVRTYLFVSLPIFDSLDAIQGSHHFKPGEHLFYWTEYGILRYMESLGFAFRESSDYESKVGRRGVKTFVWRRTLGCGSHPGTKSKA